MRAKPRRQGAKPSPRGWDDATGALYTAGDDVLDTFHQPSGGSPVTSRRKAKAAPTVAATPRDAAAPRRRVRQPQRAAARPATGRARPSLPEDAAPGWQRAPRSLPIRAWLAAGARWALHLASRITPRDALGWGAPLALATLLTVWMLTGTYWQTRLVRIVGTSDPVILAVASQQSLTGCNAFRCDFSSAEKALAALPRVRSVEIRVVYPDTTLVSVTPRAPEALWVVGDQGWYIGADGVVIAERRSAPDLARSQVAVVNDPTGAATHGAELAPGRRMDATLVAMASQLRSATQGAPLDTNSLTWTVTDGFTMRATVDGGPLVVFGTPADAAATLADLTGQSPATGAATTLASAGAGARAQVTVARAILTRLASQKTSVRLIDVRWGARPYYR